MTNGTMKTACGKIISNSSKDFFQGFRVSSQFPFCSLPVVLDTYKGCNHGCKYCFASTNNNVSSSGNKNFFGDYSKMLDAKYLDKILTGEDIKSKTDKQLRQAIEEKLPLHIGGNSDPFCFFEKEQKVSIHMLNVLAKHQYPFILSTKNGMLVKDKIYFDALKRNPNAKIQVSLISLDEKIMKELEPGVSVQDRLELIEKLSEAGVDVIVRCQPYIIGLSDKNIEEYVKTLKEKGAKSMTIEFLKVTKFLTEKNTEVFKEISDILGNDIVKYYKENGNDTGSDYELDPKIKFAHIMNLKRICHENSLKLYVADNQMRSMGDGPVCCGFDPDEKGNEAFKNVKRENISFALFKAKNNPDGIVKFTDIYKGGDFLFTQNYTTWLNAGDKKGYHQKKDKNFFFKILKSWNDIRSGQNPSRFFFDLKVHGVDENGLLTYKYVNFNETNIDTYDFKGSYEENKKIIKELSKKFEIKKFDWDFGPEKQMDFCESIFGIRPKLLLQTNETENNTTIKTNPKPNMKKDTIKKSKKIKSKSKKPIKKIKSTKVDISTEVKKIGRPKKIIKLSIEKEIPKENIGQDMVENTPNSSLTAVPNINQRKISSTLITYEKQYGDNLRKVSCSNVSDWVYNQKEFDSVIVSLPDISHTEFNNEEDYSKWFIEMSKVIISKTKNIVMFYQIDSRYNKICIDKSSLISIALAESGGNHHSLFHKICPTKKAESVSIFCPGFAHLICISRKNILNSTLTNQTPDVFYAGKQLHNNGIGIDSVKYSLDFIKKMSDTKIITNPFCGKGTVLSLGNDYGFDTVGIDSSEEFTRESIEYSI